MLFVLTHTYNRFFKFVFINTSSTYSEELLYTILTCDHQLNILEKQLRK